MRIMSCKHTPLFEMMYLYFSRYKLFNYKYVHIVEPNVLCLNKDFFIFFSFFFSFFWHLCYAHYVYTVFYQSRLNLVSEICHMNILTFSAWGVSHCYILVGIIYGNISQIFLIWMNFFFFLNMTVYSLELTKWDPSTP